jgi:antirestriction protein ArdC
MTKIQHCRTNEQTHQHEVLRDGMTPEPKVDIYQKITNVIIDAMETAGRWSMPWSMNLAHGAPINAITRKAYKGVNVLALWAQGEDKKYSSNEWATYRQWSEIGAQVRKGEKASSVVFWSTAQSKKETQDGEENSTFLFAKSYSVFNADQVDGYTAKPGLTLERTNERIPTADDWFRSLAGDVRHGGNRACYIPTADRIQMPDFDAFKDNVSYYSTLAHEYTHWTAREFRCNRELGKRFGDAAYAMEELVAELGAAFTCAYLGLTTEPRPDHAEYLKSWLTVLKADKRAIFTAASKAQQAVDYLVKVSEPVRLEEAA